MTPLFQCELFNQPFGDPALYVRLAGERKALLFDLGDISNISAGKLLKIDDVFISHTHIDHFIGFDHLIRLNLARERRLRVFGPPGLIANIQGKLGGYTWNLVADYPFIVEAVEIHPDSMKRVECICREQFALGQEHTGHFDGTVDGLPHYTVSATMLDHRIPSLAYCLQERFHININKDHLLKMGLPQGQWLRELKDAIWAGQPDSRELHINEANSCEGMNTVMTIGELKREITTISKGQKIVYISDCRGTDENMEAIRSFAADADLLFCEAAFLDEDSVKARDRGHLTARQAGEVARQAGVKELQVYHFSPRYESRAEQLYEEAQQAFEG